MSYLRFYIEIQNAVETEWNEVAHFIDMVDLIRKGNDFENKFNYNHIKIYTKTAHQKDEYLFKKMLPINTKNEIKKDDIYEKRNKFKNYNFVDFVIILKITQKYLDFKKLIPFFFIHEQCENTSMGIDLNAITDFEARESLRFSLGQFFWKWRKFTRPHAENFLFYILDHEFTDRETGQLKKARKGAFPSKEDVVLKRYSPLIEINEVIFDEFFVNTLRKTLCKIKKLEDIDNFHFYNELIADHFKIDKEEPDMKSLFIRRYIDLKEKVKLSRYLSDVIYDKFKDEPFIAFYIFCMVLDRLLFERTNTKNKKEWQKEIEKLERSGDIITFISLVSKYVSGLREVVENIIFHTDKKKGYLYFVLKSPENYLKDFQEDIFHLINERRYKEAYFLLYKLNRKKLPNKFIEVFIADTSKKGIVDKYREQYNANEKRSLKKIKLEDFFVGGLSKFPDSSHLKWRYLAQLGLKTFANIVKDKYGYFDVSTHHKGNKQHFCYFKDIETIPQYRKKWFSYLVSQNKIYGSHYNIILPISEELISDEEELRFTFEMESFIEILENWAWKKKSDSVPKIKYFDQFESYSVVQFKKKKEFIEIIGDKIASQLKNEKNSLLCIDFRILKQNSIDFSTFIKILAYVQLCKRFALIAVLNIDSNSFGPESGKKENYINRIWELFGNAA